MTDLQLGDDPLISGFQDIRPLYILPDDPFLEEFLVPAFASSLAVDCMMGFFSSHVLSALAPGLATFINHSTGTFRLVISPLISTEDYAAIREGTLTADDVARGYLEDLIVTEDLIHRHTLKCLAWLIRTGRIDIRIAIMKDALFHPKVWLFHMKDDQCIAAHGSSNLTSAGLLKNVEQVSIAASWGSKDQLYTVDTFKDQFRRLWAGTDTNCEVVALPVAIKHNLLATYSSDAPPREQDLRSLYAKVIAIPPEPPELPLNPKPVLSLPQGLNFDKDPYAHQGEAVRAWYNAGYSGILEMATGSGKTITSMICATQLFEHIGPLLIVVAAPYKPLIEQWCEEITPFGITPLNLTRAPGTNGRARALGTLRRRMRSGALDVAIVVVTHNTLTSKDFLQAIEEFECPKLLIADEVHNLGAPAFVNDPPMFFNYRLGLSATPVRQYDEDGTAFLLDYFGSVVFSYPLESAIGNCLVEYDYFVHPVELTLDEMDQWHSLTSQIKQRAWRQHDDKPDAGLKILLLKRRQVLENASSKIAILSQCLDQEDVRTLDHTLMYTSDKNPKQLQEVNSLLNSRGILFHQLTDKETSNRAETKQILQSFQRGAIRILTAKRVLDEGVNIPEITKAYILASTTVERQWVQRRGRLLRRCEAINKTYSTIHDFAVVPPEGGDADSEARSVLKSELTRMQEFAKLARNAGRSDGPLQVINELVHMAYLDT